MKTVLAIIGGLAVIGISVLFGIGWMAEPGAQPSINGRGGGSADPLGQGLNGCTHSIEKVSKMIERDDQGERVYSGQLDAWLKSDCPSEVDSEAAGGSVTGREARLWINCGKEKFWVQYVRFSKNGGTVRERTEPREQDALEAHEDGELMAPTSSIAQMTNHACREVAGGGAAR